MPKTYIYDEPYEPGGSAMVERVVEDPVDPSDFNQGGTYDGRTLLDLSDVPTTRDYLNDGWPDPRETDDDDGHLENDAYRKEHPDA